MQERLRRYNVVRWADDFVQALLSTQKTEAARRARLLTGKAYSGMIQQYRSAAHRALLLDYDGTLVPFAAEPKLAQPDAELIETLTALGSDPANQVAIISGRPRQTLEKWFGKLPISLIAEHGVWLRNKNSGWRMLKTMTADWKERVRPILQLYVDRLPGALLEEKEFSLAWHYRRADPEQASERAKELLDDLAGYTRNIDVQVFEGNKVIEIRNSGVNKGTAGHGMAETIHAGFHSRHRRRLDGRGFVPRAARRPRFPCASAWPTPPRVIFSAIRPPCGGCCVNYPPRQRSKKQHEYDGGKRFSGCVRIRFGRFVCRRA